MNSKFEIEINTKLETESNSLLTIVDSWPSKTTHENSLFQVQKSQIALHNNEAAKALHQKQNE